MLTSIIRERDAHYEQIVDRMRPWKCVNDHGKDRQVKLNTSLDFPLLPRNYWKRDRKGTKYNLKGDNFLENTTAKQYLYNPSMRKNEESMTTNAKAVLTLSHG